MSGGDCESASGYFRDFVEQAFGGKVTDDATDFGAVGVENEHRGEGVDAKLLRHSRSFSLFHVDLEIDETRIEDFAHFGLGENFACEFLAGAAPTGVAIHENLFAFLSGFGQCVFERELFEVHSVVLLEPICEEAETLGRFAGVAGCGFAEIGDNLLGLFGSHVGEVEGEFVRRTIEAEGVALGAHVVEEFANALLTAELRQFAGHINDGGVGDVGAARVDLHTKHGVGVVGSGTGGVAAASA